MNLTWMKQNGQNVVKIAKPPNTSEIIRNASDTYNGKRTRLRVWVKANWTSGFQVIMLSFPKKLVEGLRRCGISLIFTKPIRPKSISVFVQSDE